MAKLSPKQQAFCDFYIECGNATDAYMKAGYKVKSADVAKVNASRMLTNANVIQYIEERMGQKDKERVASQDEILEFLTKVMRGELTEQIPLLVGDGEQELSDKDTSIKDRTKAAELLGKRYMMWTEKHSVDANHSVTFVDDLNDED